MKTRLENDVIDHIDVVHAKNEIDLLWLIKLGRCLMKTRQDNDVSDCIGLV